MNEDKKRKLGNLRHLVTTKIALVDAGANQHSTIELFKRAPLTTATTTKASVSRDLVSSTKSQPVFKQQDVMGAITTLAVKEFPDDSEAVAISKFVEDNPTGRILREKYAKAEPDNASADLGPRYKSPTPKLAGGNQAETISRVLTDRVADVVSKTDLNEVEAWDRVLATDEGRLLRDRYEEAVR